MTTMMRYVEIKLVAVSYDGKEWSGPALKPSFGLSGTWDMVLDGIPVVGTGIFGADMKVHLVNDGPVTFWLNVPPPAEGRG